MEAKLRDLTRTKFRVLRQAAARAPDPQETNMTTRIERPADSYSPAWPAYYAENPHLRRSVGAAGDDGADGGDDGGAGGEGGGDGGDAGAGGEGGTGGAGGGEGGGEGADAVEFNVPDLKTLDLPEGFDAEKFQLQLSEDDPRIGQLKQTASDHGLSQEAMDGLAKLWAEHEVRELHSAGQAAAEEMKQLGPNAQSRIDSLARAVRGRFPEAEAEALLNDLTSAASVKAVERLLGGGAHGAQPGGRPNMGEMSIDERLRLASEQRAGKRSRTKR